MSPFFKNGYKNAVLAHFSANGLCVACPSTTKLPLGSPQGKPVNISSVNPFPAAPPVETFRYRPDRQSKGPHPSRLRRPGPRLDFAAPGRLARGIDGRLRRGKGFRARVFCRNGKPLKTLFKSRKYRLKMTINDNHFFAGLARLLFFKSRCKPALNLASMMSRSAASLSIP